MVCYHHQRRPIGFIRLKEIILPSARSVWTRSQRWGQPTTSTTTRRCCTTATSAPVAGCAYRLTKQCRPTSPGICQRTRALSKSPVVAGTRPWPRGSDHQLFVVQFLNQSIHSVTFYRQTATVSHRFNHEKKLFFYWNNRNGASSNGHWCAVKAECTQLSSPVNYKIMPVLLLFNVWNQRKYKKKNKINK